MSEPVQAPPLEGSDERKMAAALLAFLLPLLAISVIAQRAIGPTAIATVAPLHELGNAHIVEIRDRHGAVVLSGEFRARIDALGNTELDAELANQRGRGVIGEVELELPAPDREHRRPELEVDVIHLEPRQQYHVVIDDRLAGTFVTDDRGSADFELQEGELAPGTSPFEAGGGVPQGGGR